MNYGLLQPQKIDARDWKFGGISGIDRSKTILDSGQWEPYLPEFEKQYDNEYDTMACTAFGALNDLETLHKRQYGFEVNYSDRWLAKDAGNTRRGNYMASPMESIRRHGVVSESHWPSDWENIDSWEEYYKELTPESRAEAKSWLEKYIFNWEWVGTDQSALRDALRYSPLTIAIKTGAPSVDGVEQRIEGTTNHIVTLFGYEAGRYWKCFDHYRRIRLISWDFNISHAIAISLQTKDNFMPKDLPVADNWLIQNVEGDGSFALTLPGGKKMVDDLDKVLASWNMRASSFENKTGVSKETWDMYQSVDSKGNLK